MKKFASIFAFVATSLTTATAFAGSDSNCHFHGFVPAKQETVVTCATQHKNALVEKGRLDASWKPVQLEKAETVEGQKMKEWKLSFKNPAEKDASKQTLYMFYALTGNFIAANFTGK